MVWSAGLQQVNFVKNLYSPQFEIRKGAMGRLSVDDHMRILVDANDDGENDQTKAEPDASEPLLGGRVYAIGDCAANERAPLPPTAQVAEQQADYLAACLNQGLLRGVHAYD